MSRSFLRVIFFFKAYTIGSRHSSERHKPLEESGAGPSQGLPQSYENRKPVLTLSFDRTKTKLFCQLWWYKAILLTTTKILENLVTLFLQGVQVTKKSGLDSV